MDLFGKLKSIIKKGLVTLDRSDQNGQSSFLDTVSNYEAIKPYGFASIPKESGESLVLLLNVGANESNKVGFEYDNKKLFTTVELSPGEVAVYNPTKQSSYIIFKNDGETRLVGNKVAIGNSTTELLNEIENILDKIIVHTHATVMGPSGAPGNASDFTAIKALITSIKGTI